MEKEKYQLNIMSYEEKCE